jgi:hypothetical protein
MDCKEGVLALALPFTIFTSSLQFSTLDIINLDAFVLHMGE